MLGPWTISRVNFAESVDCLWWKYVSLDSAHTNPG